MKSIVLIVLISFLTFACNEKKEKQDVSNKFELNVLTNGMDTLYRSYLDSSYTFKLLPLITNLSNDTVFFISAIYGRANKHESDIFPKFGINLYKDGKKVEFSETKICGNFGNLDVKYFVEVLPHNSMLPFKKPFNESQEFDYTLKTKLELTGVIELEAYYNTIDTTQQKYHPFTNDEMQKSLAVTEFRNCRSYFLRVPHVSLKSKRVKFYLK